jgi:hypothetical protein
LGCGLLLQGADFRDIGSALLETARFLILERLYNSYAAPRCRQRPRQKQKATARSRISSKIKIVNATLFRVGFCFLIFSYARPNIASIKESGSGFSSGVEIQMRLSGVAGRDFCFCGGFLPVPDRFWINKVGMVFF